ncbi:MAG: hypothetical protein EOP04_12300, partial [Proteobacteria bacterium]
MKTVHKCIGLLVAFALFVLSQNSAFAQANFTSGVTPTSATTATLWFKPSVNVEWVDAHYNTGAAPENVRMTFNTNSGHFERSISATSGTKVNYSFTYTTGGLAYDSAQFSETVIGQSSSSSSKPSSSSVPSSSSSSSVSSGVTGGVADLGTTAVIWLKPNNVSVAWVDGHYNVNTTGQQNMRLTFNPTSGRFEQSVSVSASSSLNITYSFTYQTPSGAVDTSTATFSRNASSSSSVVSSATPSSSSVPSSIGSSSSIVTSSSVGSSTAAGYIQGVSDMGSTATIWFKSSITQEYVILHYNVGNGGQINPKMVYNDDLKRWETVINPLTQGVNIHYNFTYRGVNGDLESPWYDHKFGEGESKVIKPKFSPLGGSFFSPQNVTLSTAEPQGVIRYTLDGSAPNAKSPIYNGTAIRVNEAATINAITVAANGEESGMASSTYVVNDVPGKLNAPVFSHESGTYDTVIRVSLAGDKEGAFIHYTLDGSTPTATSPLYNTPIEVKIDTKKTPAVDTTQIKAIAVKAGWTTSPVSSATYTITSNTSSEWNGFTTFNVVNGTKGKFADSQVYWSI